jgi:FkbM family methyltransferase
MSIINKRIIPVFLRRKFKISYSQSGEDLILSTILNYVKKGFYVDVGANNPYKQSNSCLFYKKKWSGINIDALPGCMKNFNKHRKRDINLEVAIANNKEELIYYNFENTFYNTFDDSMLDQIKKQTKLVSTTKIIPQKLSQIFDNHKINKIDFLSVDVEGLDLEVLQSNNWRKYRPKVIVVEMLESEPNMIKNNPIAKFLLKNNYYYFCKTPTNSFFLEKEFYSKRFLSHFLSNRR